MSTDIASFPITLPTEIRDRSAWYGVDLAASDAWIEHLTDEEIGEVEQDAQLPMLGLRLERMLDEVLNGRGFVLIRGLPIEG